MDSYVELGLLPPDLYKELADLASVELDQDLYEAAYGEPEPLPENSVYDFNAILDSV